MSSSLQQQFDRLENSRAALFSRLEGMDDERLNRKPGEDRWSVIQVVSHLITAEKASLDYVRKKTQDPSRVAAAGLSSSLKSALLALLLRSPFRFKAPARAAEVPESRDFESARQEWDEVRVGWKSAIDELPPELAAKAIFKHPVAGPMNLAQALRFMQDHLDRHGKQIAGLLAD